ncbi:MAG: DegT/DnrJ/EryC1/StrS family aminotransferase [Oligosphaeraceae bacterium]|nr:DegT/DnrJ/EryC1/StrS family aminotransferase [Oligosphaeraceae bacterium]
MQNVKYGLDELMEIIDVFDVPVETQSKIRDLLAKDKCDAGVFFRYYNPRSKTVQLEKEYARISGSKHVLAVNSGTSALIASLVAAGIGPGDEVIIPAYTFFATASAVVIAKAIPVIADIDETLTLSPESVEKLITPRTKAIMPVHMLGLPSQMDALMALAKKHNLLVIEDAAQACGGTYHGNFLGSIGDFGCISLDAYKVIGSGEGGLLTAKDEWMFTRAQSYHDTAACWRPDRYAKERREGELFCGENYRMSELSAATALAQLRKLNDIIRTTRAAYFMLKESIKLPAGVKWVQPADPEGVCGYSLPMLFDDSEHCHRAQQTGVIGGNAGDATRGVRNWHMAWHWEHIIDQKTATSEGCPFTCPHAVQVPKYHADSWPRSKDIIFRMGTIAVSNFQKEEELKQLAEKITKGLASC